MILTVEAMTDENGNVQLTESARLPPGRRALITILEEKSTKAKNGSQPFLPSSNLPENKRVVDDLAKLFDEFDAEDAEDEKKWAEFFRLGDEIANLEQITSESMTQTVSNMRR